MGCSNTKHRTREVHHHNVIEEEMNNGAMTPMEIKEINFSEEQKKVLQKTWKTLSKDPLRHGIMVFVELFRLDPDTCPFFKVDKNDTGYDTISNNENVRIQAQRVMKALQAGIDAIDLIADVAGPIYEGLGVKHIYIGGFEAHFFMSFEKATLLHLENTFELQYTRQVREVWEALMCYIADTMRKGFFEGYGQKKAAKNQE